MSANRLIWDRVTTAAEINRLLDTLGMEYPVADSGEGRRIRFEPIAKTGILDMSAEADGSMVIRYGSLPAAARGVGHALAGETVSEEMAFTTFGIMLDCSRNAVMTVPYLKKWLRRLALLGYNMLMLYTEDTYQLPGEPYFGWLRGGYSLADIRELDDYAFALGIEMIGCIQTLGHLKQIIRWGQFPNDTDSVLLVDDERTYQLIGKMLDFWSGALRSRRIHLGMDETHDLGRGKFMDLHGYERGFDIFNRHLKRVNEQCQMRGLQPIIWSDMYFRMGSKTMDYYDYDAVIPDDVKKAIPAGVTLCYWDYYHTDQAFYEEWIRRHRALGSEPHMGSGVWTWSCVWYDHEQTLKTVTPCLRACRKLQVKNVYFTMWGDDGGYCDYDSGLAGLAWAANLSWGGQGSEAETAPLFEAVCGASYHEQLTASKIQNTIPSPVPGNEPTRVYASSVLWDDPLLGINWREYQRFDRDIWEKLLKQVRAVREELAPAKHHRTAGDLEHAWNICEVMVKKIELRMELLRAYGAGDREALRRIRDELAPGVIAACTQLAATFRRQWLRRNQPFGLEVMQHRFGGIIARYEELACRIGEYLDGALDSIPELETSMDEPRGIVQSGFSRCISGSCCL